MSEPLPTTPTMGATGCLIRAAWMLGGPVALVATALAMSTREPFVVSWLDGTYLLILLVVFAIRYLDYRALGGTDADGKPATRRVLIAWYVKFACGALVAWGAGHGLAWLMG